MERPTVSINGCVDAHGRLDRVISGLEPKQFSHASTLAGWTIGHVLAHLVLNAEAMVQRIEAAREGDLIEQYSGGVDGRADSIDRLARLDPPQWISRIRDSAQRLDTTFEALPTHAWALPVRTVKGGSHAISLLPFRRWREVEVHVVDLGIGVEPKDWSDEFVNLALPRLIAGMTDRADQRELTAWLLGRGKPPDLASWG